MIDKQSFLKQIDELVFYQDDIAGAKLIREMNNEDKQVIKKDEEMSSAFLVLQFVIIPFLPTEEISGLLTEHLTVGLMIDGLDLSERITKKLISMDLSDRDNCKNALKKALVDNQETITDEVVANGKKIKTTADWLKDYLSQVGSAAAKTLDQAKYFYEQKYVFGLKEDDKEMLKRIFDLYKFLNTSSLTPEGFEDDLLLKDKDGRIITTNKGKVVVLYDPKKDINRTIVKAPAPPSQVNKSISGKEIKINELKQMADDYIAGSFERKTIEEEIKKMEL